MKQEYFIEECGEYYQSVFPENQAEYSQIHSTIEDAIEYMTSVVPNCIPSIISGKESFK